MGFKLTYEKQSTDHNCKSRRANYALRHLASPGLNPWPVLFDNLWQLLSQCSNKVIEKQAKHMINDEKTVKQTWADIPD